MKIADRLNEEIEIDEAHFNTLLLYIKKEHGYDFHHYANASLKRRILRLLELFRISSIPELITKLKKDPDFIIDFLAEITVNVTEMFRDPSAWQNLRDNILPLLAEQDKINIWHAGCATGEEVYTMAIILKEMGILEKSYQIATDINPLALDTAQNGVYSYRKIELYTKNYIQYEGKEKISNYYKTQGANIVFNKNLKTNIIFKEQNLIDEGNTLNNIDLILCRNVLIYFDNLLQNRVLDTFNHTLKMGGILMLGHYESLVWCSNISKFEIITDNYNIIRKTR